MKCLKNSCIPFRMQKQAMQVNASHGLGNDLESEGWMTPEALLWDRLVGLYKHRLNLPRVYYCISNHYCSQE